MKQRYFEGISRKSITVCGVYPPPIGGVSTHVQRVVDYLTHQYNKVFFFDTERRSFLPNYLIRLMSHIIKKRPDIIHFHATYARSMIFDLVILYALSFILRFELIVIEHDCRHLYRRTWITKKLFRRCIRAATQVVMMGESAYKSYQECRIRVKKYTIESAFLPPAQHTELSIVATYSSSLNVFFEQHTPIILFNAAHIMLQDNQDVYGFDQAIEMVSLLQKNYPDVGLLMVVAWVNNKEYFDLLCERMAHLSVSENIYILQDQKELWPLFKKVDLLIRPTLSDGASISIEEALYFGVPVVASDAVSRQEEVVLYKKSDVKDLAIKVDTVLKEKIYGAQAKRNHLHEKSA